MFQHLVDLSIDEHVILPHKNVVEIRQDANLLGTITQGDKPKTIRFLTKHNYKIVNIINGPGIMSFEIEFETNL